MLNMTGSEKNEKIKSLVKEFKEKANELEQEDKKNHTNINLLDNGKTKYTELYEKYKVKINKLLNS